MGGGYGDGGDDGGDDDESELSFHLTCAPYKPKFAR